MTKELVEIKDSDVKEIFYSENGLQVFVDNIESIVKSHKYDLKTTKGKDAIKTLAASVSRSKTYLDGKGKELVSGVKSKLKIVDANRKSMRDQLDVLRDKAREPLTAYEEEQKAIAYKVTETTNKIEKLSLPFGIGGNSLSLECLKENYKLLCNVDTSHIPEALNIDKNISDGRQVLINEIEKIEKQIKDNEELEKLRSEKAEEEVKEQARLAEISKKEHEEKIAKEAAEAAEQKAKQAEQDKIDAQERAEQAEKDKALAEAKVKSDAEQAEKDRIEAAKQAEIRAEQAAEQAKQNEITRQENEKAAKEETQRKIESNKRHVGSVRREIKEHIMEKCEIDEPLAKNIVLALLKTERVTINY